jgi:hypothetical protein
VGFFSSNFRSYLETETKHEADIHVAVHLGPEVDNGKDQWSTKNGKLETKANDLKFVGKVLNKGLTLQRKEEKFKYYN